MIGHAEYEHIKARLEQEAQSPADSLVMRNFDPEQLADQVDAVCQKMSAIAMAAVLEGKASIESVSTDLPRNLYMLGILHGWMIANHE